MYKQKIIICILSISFLFSCSNDEGNESDSHLVSLTLKSSYNDFRVGDAIGVFVEKRTNENIQSAIGTSNYQTNLKWIYQEDGTWKPATSSDEIYTSANGMPLDIYAYYPYTNQIISDKIELTTPSQVMTGSVLRVNSTQANLEMDLKTALVKVLVPDIDILSSKQVTMLDVLSGGTISLNKFGEQGDFTPSSDKSNVTLVYEKGYFMTYLPEQLLDQNKHLLDVEDGGTTTNFTQSTPFQIVKDGDNVIVADNVMHNVSDMPNSFMLNPGDEIFISVKKAFGMWQENSSLASTNPDLSGTLTAEVIWQEDQHEIIDNITVVGESNKAVLHVKTKLGQKGNAIVAVKIGGVIRWSWQLWVSDYNPISKKNGTTYEFNGLTFMDRNLGSTIDPNAGGDRTFGLHYQWGRKDPFPIRGNVLTANVSTDAVANLANSITSPNAFILSTSSPNDWYTKTGNLWPERWNSEQNTKTPFDPCPKGWRVPASNINNDSPWYGLTLPEDENKWGNGWYFEGNNNLGYYPAAGQRTALGENTYTGSAGFYHTARSNTAMRIDFTSVNLSFGGGKAAGRSVRCVKEQ